MGGERVASFLISLDADSTDIKSALSGLRSAFQSTVSDIESLTRKTTVFEGLEKNIQSASVALTKAQQDVTTFTGALAAAQGAGKDVTKELQTGLKAAQTEVSKATNEYNKSVDALTKLQGTLSRAGVDTSNLAAAQAKLAEQAKNATNAAANQAAQQLLGLKTVRDTTPEIQKLYAAYNTLSVQGGLSAKELTVAQGLLQAKIAETRQSVSGVGVAAKESGFDLAGFFTGSILPALGLVGGLTAVIGALKSIIDAGKEFRQGLVEIGTVSNLTDEQLKTLGQGARALAEELGLNVNEVLKQTAALLRSGVPEENVLDVLRISAIAAKASVSDLASGVKAADLLISGLGIPVAELGRSLDIVVQGAKDGGVTLKEFAENGGSLVNVAKAANVPLIDLIATLKVMVNAGLDAGTAIGDLGRIIAKLQTDEAREKLRALGITTTNLVEIFQQLGAQNLPIDKVLDLGIASTKSAAAVSALTGKSAELGPELERLGNSANIAQVQLDKMIDSPKERTDRFNAAWDGFKLRFSETVGTGGAVASVLTEVLASQNRLHDATQRASEGQQGFIDKETAAIKALFGYGEAAKETKVHTDALATSTAEAAETQRQATVKANEANSALTAASAKLLEQVAALQSASARAITEVNQLADNQIAVLDKSAKAIAETTQATLLIQRQAADDRLKIIVDNEKKVTEATDAAIAGRIKSLQAAGKSQTDIDAEVTKIRLASLTPILAQYQDHYNKLIGLAQEWKGKVDSIEESRIAFNRDVEKTLFDLRVGGLSAFDQYLAKVKEVERLIAEARTAGTQGNLKEAENFTKQAIALATSIGTVIGATGVKVVTDLQAQEAKVGLVQKAAAGLNEAYAAAGDAVRTGQVLAEVYQGRAQANLLRMQIIVDDLNDKAAKGLKLNVELNEEKVAAAKATLDELSKPRTVTLTVQTVQSGATVSIGGGATGSFNAGGPVSKLAAIGKAITQPIRNFAGGGSVFKTPTWNKVPGVGNEDTVPARLSVGSYVLRKAASGYYGDTILGRLAQAFAGGGNVNFPNIAREPLVVYKNKMHKYPDKAWVNNWQVQERENESEAEKLLDIKTEARGFFDSLLEWGRGLPHSQFGDLSDYILRGKDRIEDIRDDPALATTILNFFKEQSDLFVTTFRAARVFHVPATQPINARFDDKGGLPLTSLARLGDPVKKAAGGSVDSVPALLTPGEHVMRPQAVNWVHRMFGGGFLDAMNQMKVPRGFFDGIANLAPPRPLMFEHGGMVPGGPALSIAGGGTTPVKLEVNINGARITEQDLNTVVLPWFNKLANRSK